MPKRYHKSYTAFADTIIWNQIRRQFPEPEVDAMAGTDEMTYTMLLDLMTPGKVWERKGRMTSPNLESLLVVGCPPILLLPVERVSDHNLKIHLTGPLRMGPGLLPIFEQFKYNKFTDVV